VALVSFDDIDLFKFTSPPITAISQPLEKLGEHAMEMLFGLMNKKEPVESENTNGHRVVLPVELKVRESCG
jgi:DNA-binding LacI/PurR family transcriptional regulator